MWSKESCHTYWNESRHVFECLNGWGDTHHLTHSNIEFYIEMCCLCHMWHDSFYIWLILIPMECTNVTRLIQIRDVSHLNMRDTTHSTMWHDPRMRNLRHDTLICVTWLILHLTHFWSRDRMSHVPYLEMNHVTSMNKVNYRSLLQNIVSLIGLFCKRDP